MKKKITAVTLTAMLFALCGSVEAQQQAKVPKIGWLGAGPGLPPTSPSELFWREFRKLGYVEGKNIATEYRYADNKLDRLPALADELVRLKVEILVAGGTNAALAARDATRTIPIVFLNVSDPVADGLVDSLARPRRKHHWIHYHFWGAGRQTTASYSRKRFQSSPELRCCGTLRIEALRDNGKKTNCRHENWVCSCIPWRSAARTNIESAFQEAAKAR